MQKESETEIDRIKEKESRDGMKVDRYRKKEGERQRNKR